MGEKKDEKLQSLKGKCVVKDKRYNNYYYGGASYGSEFKKAMIFDSNGVPDYIKRNQNEEIIPLDSERGLKLIVDEIHYLAHYLSIEEPRITKAKEGLEKLENFDLVQRYLQLYGGINELIRRPNEETKNNLIKRILSENK